MSELISAIDYSVDFKQLAKDTKLVLDKYPFNNHNQICFQNTVGVEADPYQGTGDSRLDHCPMYGLEESDFTEFNPEFNGTVFEEIFKTFPHNMGRIVVLDRFFQLCRDAGRGRHAASACHQRFFMLGHGLSRIR